MKLLDWIEEHTRQPETGMGVVNYAMYCKQIDGDAYWRSVRDFFTPRWVFIAREWAWGVYCNRFGHRWEDDSWATPDSGYMGQTCGRCGLHHGQTLY